MSETNGRGPNGRFGTGNKFGKGAPLAARANQLRAALFAAVTEDDIRAIAKKMIELARSGDVQAGREILDRTIGKASPVELLQRLEALEMALAEKELDNIIGHQGSDNDERD